MFHKKDADGGGEARAELLLLLQFFVFSSPTLDLPSILEEFYFWEKKNFWNKLNTISWKIIIVDPCDYWRANKNTMKTKQPMENKIFN